MTLYRTKYYTELFMIIKISKVNLPLHAFLNLKKLKNLHALKNPSM